MGENNQVKCQKSFLLLSEIGAEEGNENEKEIWIFQLIQSFCTKYLYLSSLVEGLWTILMQNNLSKIGSRRMYCSHNIILMNKI